jgi:hypothetical protein
MPITDPPPSPFVCLAIIDEALCVKPRNVHDVPASSTLLLYPLSTGVSTSAAYRFSKSPIRKNKVLNRDAREGAVASNSVEEWACPCHLHALTEAGTSTPSADNPACTKNQKKLREKISSFNLISSHLISSPENKAAFQASSICLPDACCFL